MAEVSKMTETTTPPVEPAKKEEKKVTTKKPAAKKTAATNGDQAPYALVSKIESHGGVTYTKLTRTELAELRDDTTAIPGRPGLRRDGEGGEWYSAAWLND